MSLNKLAQKVYAEAIKDYDDELVDAESLFIQAFIIGFMYCNDIGKQEVELVFVEDQLDLPIH